MTFEDLMGAYYINDDLRNRVVYDNLLKQLKNDRITPVIGAGLSVWAGYPLWGGLLINKAKGTKIEAEVKKLINNSEFEKAATVVSDFYRRNKFLRTLQNEFSPDKINEAKRPGYQYLLKDIFKGPFVTTNYDKCLDLLLKAAYTVNPQDEFNEAAINEHIQNHKHFLVKLHGTVYDPSHMILTEESYNNAYGDKPEKPERNKPLPKTLETIFKASPPLFLGCGLGNDRTCAVFKSCVGATGFALVEMPENDDEFDETDERLDDMNLQVIWYPHGQHEAAVEVLIRQLAKDLGIDKDSEICEESGAAEIKPDDQEIQYSGSEYFIGRDDIVEQIAEKLKNPDAKVLLVHGVAGIGKTEICKAVYRRLKEENPDFLMPFIDIAETKSVAEFWERLAKGLDIRLDGVGSSEQIFELICNRVYNKNLIVYLDNFEDILSVGDEEEKRTFINSLYDLSHKYGLRLLISSQEKISFGECIEAEALDGGIDVTNLPWEQFIKLNQVKLFINAFGREPRKDERDSFKALISELSGHPLSIIITALYDRENISINDLLEIWQEIETQIPGDKKDSHRSLRLATELPWRKIKGNKAAVFRWALHTHSIMPLDSKTLRDLNAAQEEPFSDKEWIDGGKMLNKHGLTEKTADGKERMLLALKTVFRGFGDEAEEALKRAFKSWIKVCGDILERGDERKRENYFDCHDRALDFLPQCFTLAEQCLEAKAYPLLRYLMQNAYNYYKYDVIRALPLLKKLIEKTPEEFSLRGSFYEKCGYLLWLTGEFEKALKAYDEAEKLYKAEHNNLGFANVLLSRGDLLRQTGKLEKALKAYDEAEELYKSEQDNLGRANVLLSRGDLLSQTGELEKALKAYDEAEELFKAVQANLGRANVLLSRGELLRQTGEPEKAMKAYDEAEELYKSEQDNLGRANVLLSRGDLLSLTGEPEKALKAYDEAEELYKSEQANLGRANVLFGKGDLKLVQEDWSGAEELYEKALPLYIQEQDSMGTSYTLVKLQLCQKQLGDEEGRKKCLEQLEELLPKQVEVVQEWCRKRIELADSL